jgi:hypothetical protein
LGLAASIALVSCGSDSATALDLRLVLTGSIDQIEVRSVLVEGTALDLTGEQTLFPKTPRMLVTGEVLTIRFAGSAGGKSVTVTAVGLRCGQAVTDPATTLPRELATATTTSADLILEVTRTASCDGGIDAAGGSGSGVGGGRGGAGGSVGGQSGTAGAGGTAGTGGAGGTTGAGGIGGTAGAGGTAARGGTGGVAGISGAGGTGGVAGTAGRGGTGGAGATAGVSGAGGSAGGTGGRGGTGAAGTGGQGGTGGGAAGGSGGTTKPNGQPCAGGAECTSGNCVDAVCCDTPAANCAGCKACNLNSSRGTCANVLAGTDPHNFCPADPSNCAAGGCTAGSCTPAANTVLCKSTCAPPNQQTRTLCNGQTLGCNNAEITTPCLDHFVCTTSGGCYISCLVDNHCVSGYYCSGGSCLAKVGDGQPCSAANQCISGACVGYHRDADGDTYGVAATTNLCGSAPPAGYVTNATDCCDADMDVRPGQTGWFTSGSAACGGTFDYNCASGAELQYGSGTGACTNTGACTVSDPRFCQTTQGWSGTAPGCGGTGTYITGCNVAGSECTPNCADPGSCGRGCATAIAASRTQGCH